MRWLSIGFARWSFAAAVLLAPACSDPFNDVPCLSGAIRDPGPGCALPNLAFDIRGPEEQWESPEVASLGNVRLGRNGDRELLFYIPTPSAPVTDGTFIWGVLLRDPDLFASDDRNSFIQFSTDGAGATASYNGIVLSGLPIGWAVGTRGVQLAVPIDVIPFPGQAILEDYRLIYQDGQFEIADYSVFGSSICWDPQIVVGNSCTSPL